VDIRVVAECIETQAQSQFLANEGCDIAQGYFYGFPQPAASVKKLL
jgi:EAL domain-containing protein (putative c-di-GMP-specific phosphodiesterase class I)